METSLLIQPISVDLPTPPLLPTDGADADDRSTNGVLIPVWCSHRSRKFETESHLTEPILVYNFQIFGYSVVLLSMHFKFF